MMYLRMFLVLSVLWINGCSSHQAVAKPRGPMTMMDVYANSTGQAKKDVAEFVEKNLKEQNTFGYVKPYIPVVNEPVVRKVWIPDHKSDDNSDVMIAGHWAYLMVQPASWFIDGDTVDTKLPVIVPLAPTLSQESRKEEKPYGS
ncbi:MAG: hypothetical protein HQL15_10090 [Candidatus Omnitrophica bacterium]|nr:hypothetical protein [Candidatus Omnitrophota bacterium]